ncbi:MAG: hypothetical protein GC129_04660 [Proteobacteria bacterium]|nr:hypothetical protein [Pseudomonadota bacterium]
MALTWRPHLAQAAFPLTNAVLLTIFALAAPSLGIPELAELTTTAQTWFAHYGFPILFISAFLEALYMVNFYFPGSLIIVLAVLLSPKTFSALALVTAICWLAFMAANLVNYALGRYGFYRLFNFLGAEDMLRRTSKFLARYGHLTTFLAAFHPNWLALVMVCYGMSRFPPTRAFLYAGLSMAVTGPILTTLVATTTLFTQHGGGLFITLIALFYLWAAAEVAASIWRSRTKRMRVPPTRKSSGGMQGGR